MTLAVMILTRQQSEGQITMEIAVSDIVIKPKIVISAFGVSMKILLGHYSVKLHLSIERHHDSQRGACANEQGCFDACPKAAITVTNGSFARFYKTT